MKKLLALLLVLTMTLSLAACGSKKEEPAKPDDKPATSDDKKDSAKETDGEKEPAAKEEKVLNLLEAENISSLVTWLATDSVSFGILGNISGGLMVLGVDGLPKYDMAESHEVTPDGLKYTFKLREGLKWVTIDGEEYGEITADDFVFSWKKLLDPAEAAQYAVMLDTASIKNGPEAFALNTSIVTYETKQKELKGLKLEDYKDTEEQTAQQQYDEAKKELDDAIAKLEKELFDAHSDLAGAKAALQVLIDGLGVTAVDKHTLEIQLNNPVPFFIELMSFASFFPANEKFYNEVGKDKFGKTAENFLYSGAYIFKEWKISERHYLVKNPLYWDAANVDVDAIDFRVIEGINNDTAVQMYLDGETDSSSLSGENVDKYANRPDAVQLGESVLFYLSMNINNGALTPSKKVLRDARARKAINMAIDKSYITDVIFKNGSAPADYFIPKGFVASKDHNKGFREVAQDLYSGGDGYNKLDKAKAKELWSAVLKEQNVDKVNIECIIYSGDTAKQVGTHIKDELEKALPNTTVELLVLPFSEKLKRTTDGDFSMNWGGWGPDYLDAMTFMDMWITGGAYNRGKYSNEYYDEGIAAAKSGELTAPDKSKERFEKLVELEKILLEDDQVVVPLYQRNRLGLRNPKIKDLVLQQFGADYIYKWVKLAE